MRRLAAVFALATLAGMGLAAQPPVRGPVPEIKPVPTAIPVPDGPVVNKSEPAPGLIAEDLKVGDGIEVKAGAAVVVHYHGTLKNGGKVFDSSFTRGEPIALPLSGVIEGWQKGVPGMKVGGVRRLTIPAALGYGERGAGADIPPNADLVFTIQVVDTLGIEDLKVGEGDEAKGQCVAVATYSITDKEGNVVEKAEAGKPYIWLPGEFQAVDFGLEGMKVGGKRRISVPAAFNVSAPQMGGSRPANVPLTVEIELIAVRNLGH